MAGATVLDPRFETFCVFGEQSGITFGLSVGSGYAGAGMGKIAGTWGSSIGEEVGRQLFNAGASYTIATTTALTNQAVWTDEGLTGENWDETMLDTSRSFAISYGSSLVGNEIAGVGYNSNSSSIPPGKVVELGNDDPILETEVDTVYIDKDAPRCPSEKPTEGLQVIDYDRRTTIKDVVESSYTIPQKRTNPDFGTGQVREIHVAVFEGESGERIAIIEAGHWGDVKRDAGGYPVSRHQARSDLSDKMLQNEYYKPIFFAHSHPFGGGPSINDAQVAYAHDRGMVASETPASERQRFRAGNPSTATNNVRHFIMIGAGSNYRLFEYRGAWFEQ